MTETSTGTLVDLLGDTRGRVVELLLRNGRSAAELAAELGLSEVAIRRHLQVLERDGFVRAHTVRRAGPGRPSAHYELTDRATRLFPDRSAELANELLAYMEREHGHADLVRFLRWRQERQGARYAASLGEVGDGIDQQVGHLAELLSEDGFLAEVEEATTPDGATVLALTQGHCAIKEVAREHPEVCAFEAGLFKQLLGAKVSRRQTIAAGAGACVCHIEVPQDRDAGNARERGAQQDSSITELHRTQDNETQSTGVRHGDKS